MYRHSLKQIRYSLPAKWKLALVVFIVVALVSSAFLLLQPPTENSVCFKSNCFEVEVVTSEVGQFRGLSGRDSLASNRGMLFVFASNGYYAFWMKDMKFSLDIIWISKNGSIVDVMKNALPCTADNCTSIFPDVNASYVLELNAGVFDKSGMKLGEKFEINLRS